MQQPISRLGTVVAALAWSCGLAHHAMAQPAAEPFPAGKQISVHVGVNPGGGNDQIMRLVARHIGKHLPGNPSVVARNTPGAGGRRLAGLLANTAPRDGTEFAMLHRGIVTEHLLGDVALPFKVQDLTWIGTPTSTTDSCIVWYTARVQSIDDLKEHELVLAGDGNEAWQVYLLQRLVGARIRSVVGYPGGTAMNLALERGEAGGRCGYSWQALKAAVPDWLRDKKVKPIVQFALTRHSELKDVPLILDYAKTDLDRQALRLLVAPQVFGFPFAAPPGLLPQVRDLLRTAFDRTMLDPAFRDDASKIRLELDPVDGGALARVVGDVYSASPDVVTRAKGLIAPN
jgi:tripartite-type tricarboxylate transporter receptor subunit TctC